MLCTLIKKAKIIIVMRVAVVFMAVGYALLSTNLNIQGTTPTATGSASTIGESAFNTNYDDNAYAGYMYGAAGSTSYEETHANTNDSAIKTVIDAWYEENLLDNYSTYIADSGFCGDRSLSSGNGYGTSSTNYGPYNRLYTNKTPQFGCPQNNDLYTTSSSTKGNKALDYPIGLITADEVAYAGGVYVTVNTNYYLYTGANYLTMSPNRLFGIGPSEWYVYSNGYLTSSVVGVFSAGIRPVINLKSTVEITSGNGTSSSPYVIKTN